MGQEPTPLTTPSTTEADMLDDPTTTTRAAMTRHHDDPADLRRDIAATRGEMEETLEAINDRVNPQRVYKRRSARARRRWAGLKESVMGSSDASSTSWNEHTPDVDVSGRAQQAREAMSDAPDAARRTTRGNPLAAGTIAFGIGALIGSALPATPVERRAAREADRQLDLQSTKERLTRRAQQVGADVKDATRDAADDLAAQARSAARDVRSDARDEGRRVTQEAKHATERARHDL